MEGAELAEVAALGDLTGVAYPGGRQPGGVDGGFERLVEARDA